MTPELSRPFAIDRMGEASRVTVEATATERDAVAKRLGAIAIAHLVCRFQLRRWEGATVQAEGTLQARVTQTCVVSSEAFDTDIAEDFDIRFVPEGMESDDIDLDAPDEIPYAGASIDLGEATTEQLALALDPFPKKPGAAIADDAQDPPEGPFAALARVRK
jgi:uncharacterized metal-binding protein YceD (DUF177 family)